MPKKETRKSSIASAEAIRRIESAVKAGDTALDLRIDDLVRLPQLGELHSFQSLNLSGTQILDLEPIAGCDQLKELDLSGTNIFDLSSLPPLASLERLRLSSTEVSDLTPVARLTNLNSLHLDGTPLSDLAPIGRLTSLRRLILPGCPIYDLWPISNLRNLEALNLMGTRISNLEPLSNLRSLQLLSVSSTQVFDLSPLASTTSLIDGAISQRYFGLVYSYCPLKDERLLRYSALENPDCTILTINYLREEQGLPSYRDSSRPKNKGTLRSDIPEPLDGVPSPFDFDVTEHGTITLAASDTNAPAFRFPTSRRDHSHRLDACKVLAKDLAQALSRRQYDNVRPEYLSYLERYLDRLPADTEDGNMLLADGMARGLHHLFAAEADVLPVGLASELRVLLEQHIAVGVYYPEIGTFNRDVRDGKTSAAFPIAAAMALVEEVEAHTPDVFEPMVSDAFSDAQSTPPPLPVLSVERLQLTRDTIVPPRIPDGITDPKASREFATASTANRLWKTMERAGQVATVGGGLSLAAHEMAPHMQELLHWLAEVLKVVN